MRLFIKIDTYWAPHLKLRHSLLESVCGIYFWGGGGSGGGIAINY